MIGLRTELHIPDIKAIFCHKSCSLPWKVCNTKKHKSWSDKSDCWSLEEEVEKITASLLGKEQFSTVVSEGDSSFKTCRKRHSLELKIEKYLWFFRQNNVFKLDIFFSRKYYASNWREKWLLKKVWIFDQKSCESGEDKWLFDFPEKWMILCENSYEEFSAKKQGKWLW